MERVWSGGRGPGQSRRGPRGGRKGCLAAETRKGGRCLAGGHAREGGRREHGGPLGRARTLRSRFWRGPLPLALLAPLLALLEPCFSYRPFSLSHSFCLHQLSLPSPSPRWGHNVRGGLCGGRSGPSGTERRTSKFDC